MKAHRKGQLQSDWASRELSVHPLDRNLMGRCDTNAASGTTAHAHCGLNSRLCGCAEKKKPSRAARQLTMDGWSLRCLSAASRPVEIETPLRNYSIAKCKFLWFSFPGSRNARFGSLKEVFNREHTFFGSDTRGAFDLVQVGKTSKKKETGSAHVHWKATNSSKISPYY